MRSRAEQIATVSITVAALAVAGSAVHREFFTVQAPPPQLSQILKTEYLADWRAYRSAGVTMGDSAAKVSIVVFSDFECPFCRQFHAQAVQAMSTHVRDVEPVFVHYPLASHRFAKPTAQAAECAATQGRFLEFASVAFAQQDSLGLKSWGRLAAEAGVADTATLASCARRSELAPRITAGLELGKRIGVIGTPTVLINGWRYSTPPTANLEEELAAIIATGRPSHMAGDTIQFRRRSVGGT